MDRATMMAAGQIEAARRREQFRPVPPRVHCSSAASTSRNDILQ
jgi:hypothetical protein